MIITLLIVSWLALHLGQGLEPAKKQLISPKLIEAKNVKQDLPNYQAGKASWYWDKPCDGRRFCKTSSGYPFTACWDNYPKGTLFAVNYNNNSVIVECTDRGQFKEMGRVLDLSAEAFRRLAPLSKGIIEVKYSVLKYVDEQGKKI